MEIEANANLAGADYDKRAAIFDRLVRSPAYNRLAWSYSPSVTRDFAAHAIEGAEGPVLEVAAGTSALTAHLHVRSGRETVLTDLSEGMLKRAGSCIDEAATDKPGPPPSIRLVQADLFALPFDPGGFTTVLGLGLVHLFDDLAALKDALCTQLAPGGAFHIAGLVAETYRGGAYLQALHRAGEAAPPRTAAEMRGEFGDPARFHVAGCMAFAVIEGPPA